MTLQMQSAVHIKQQQWSCAGPRTDVAKIECVARCVAACCSVLQRVAACCRVLQSVVACCRVLQSVAECCSVLQRVTECCRASRVVLQRVAACCSVLQCVARFVCVRSMIQPTRTHCTRMHTDASPHSHTHIQTHSLPLSFTLSPYFPLAFSPSLSLSLSFSPSLSLIHTNTHTQHRCRRGSPRSFLMTSLESLTMDFHWYIIYFCIWHICIHTHLHTYIRVNMTVHLKT